MTRKYKWQLKSHWVYESRGFLATAQLLSSCLDSPLKKSMQLHYNIDAIDIA